MKETRTVESSTGASLTIDHWPGAGSTVVLAHGGGQTRHSWGGTADALVRSGHRVISMDLRGHGDSSWSAEGDYAMAAFRDDALAVVSWADEPVAWVGASLGGMTGLLAVDAEPDRFNALVLVDITPKPSLAGVDRILTFMAETSTRGFESLDEAADAVATYQPHRPRPVDSSGLAKNLRCGEDGRWRWHWDPAFVTSRRSMTNTPDRHHEQEEACRRLTLPTLLVRGRLSDLVTEEEVAAFLALAPHANYVDVADAAHMIAGDKNDVFTSAITDFLDG